MAKVDFSGVHCLFLCHVVRVHKANGIQTLILKKGGQPALTGTYLLVSSDDQIVRSLLV